MNDINELLKIISSLDGSASTDEIAIAYAKKYKMPISLVQKSVINFTLSNYKGNLHLNSVTQKWELKSAANAKTSELSKVVTASAFEKAYTAFIEQADKNAKKGKSNGKKIPFGFSEKPSCDGADFMPHYGQGGPSTTPYMNWWVVSIYYLPTNGNIVMGIEANRYPHLREMQIKPLRYEQIGKKKVSIAVFYSTNKSNVNYNELYDKFIDVCEEVMRLGLE